MKEITQLFERLSSSSRIETTQRSRWFDSLKPEEAHEIAALVGFDDEIEDKEAYYSWLLDFIYLKVEEWRECTWQEYPQRVMDWYKKANELQCLAAYPQG